MLSVIVCTYNRCQLLAKALESIAASAVPETVQWEVLVMDNNSSDQTREVVEDFSKRFKGRFRYYFEPRRGKSFALNSGISESSGEVLAFTDDDVVVDSTWLWSLTAPLLSGEWAGAGGRIIPVWGRPLPRWLAPEGVLLSGPFVALDLGPHPVSLNQAPVGANMAFRRDVFTRYGGFRTDLGPTGEQLRKGEDSEFSLRLLNDGGRLRYEPSAVVHHPVPPNRLQKRYLLSWYFSHGRFEIPEQTSRRRTRLLIAGIPWRPFRGFIRWSVQWLFSTTPSKRFSARLQLWAIAGTILGCYELAHKSGQSDSVVAGFPSTD
jgi:glycosyltransferase involved in cell wall biosynthesis